MNEMIGNRFKFTVAQFRIPGFYDKSQIDRSFYPYPTIPSEYVTFNEFAFQVELLTPCQIIMTSMTKAAEEISGTKRTKVHKQIRKEASIIFPESVIGCYDGKSDFKLSEKEGFAVHEQTEAASHS